MLDDETYLPHTNNGVSDKDEQNNEWFNESFNTFMFFKKS